MGKKERQHKGASSNWGQLGLDPAGILQGATLNMPQNLAGREDGNIVRQFLPPVGQGLSLGY